MSNNINWVKIMEDNREVIEEKIREAKEEAYKGMQGWHVDIEIDESGEAWITGLMSTGSQSISSWKEETFIVCSIKSWEVEFDDEEELRYSDEKIYAKFLTQKNNEDGHERAIDFMYAGYPELLEELQKQWEDECKNWAISEFDASEILDRVIDDEGLFHQYD